MRIRSRSATSQASSRQVSAQGLSRLKRLMSALALVPGLVLGSVPQQAFAQALHPTYARAKRELRPEMYVMYRIVERISRANGLTDSTWRVRVIPQYNINAFATEANLIGVFAGMYDAFYGDNDALACAIGHEMAHHTRRHVAIGSAQEQAISQQKQAENDEKQRGLRDQDTAGAFLGGWVGGILRSDAQRRSVETAQKKEQERKEQIMAMYRQQEMEADELGYVYVARAGFNPEGCMRMMNLLARTPGAELDTSHPNVPSRMTALQDMMGKNPPSSLRTEGMASLNRSQPLTYGMSIDGQSLRINSRVSAPGVTF